MTLQPWLHDLQIAVDGPATVLASKDGSMGGGATGWYVDDRRLLKGLNIALGQAAPTPIASSASGCSAHFWGAARHLGDTGADPTVEVHQRLEVRGGQLTIEVRATSRAITDVETQLTVKICPDATDVASVKGGGSTAWPASAPSGPHIAAVGLSRTGSGPTVSWADGRHRTTVHYEPATADVQAIRTADHAEAVALTWPVRLSQGGQATIRLTLDAQRLDPSAFDADAGSDLCDWTHLPVVGDDEWQTLIRSNLSDLQHLLQVDPLAKSDVFAAAGTPWYLTLFGRDALWTARMMVPYSLGLAEGTLRALARRQATVTDPTNAAEPGKILHEVRRTAYAEGDLLLPTIYYGTVDATALWIVLLHEAWREGLPVAVVAELRPHLLAGLEWMRNAVAASPDGLLRYLDSDGRGLSNQGWKDSGDSMRRADGSIAPAPIALLEAQAYAVQAARGAAELLDELAVHEATGGSDPAGESGLPQAPDWRVWAQRLADRVRETYWVDHVDGRYLAMALDAESRPVDGVGSNMGHALATGLLSEEEESEVAERLMRPDMLREFGIGTLSSDNPAYNPTGYHTGSVWTHDSAIILRGLALAGFAKEADRVHQALVRLGARSQYRFPELIAGQAVGSQPVPYPASCRPQAWAAASAAVLLHHRDNR